MYLIRMHREHKSSICGSRLLKNNVASGSRLKSKKQIILLPYDLDWDEQGDLSMSSHGGKMRIISVSNSGVWNYMHFSVSEFT